MAGWYGWMLGDRYSYHLAGFDPDWAEHGVRFLLLAHIVRSAMEEGAAVYDMLRGDEPYKRRFADSERQIQTIAVTESVSWPRLRLKLDSTTRQALARVPPEWRERLRARARPLASRSRRTSIIKQERETGSASTSGRAAKRPGPRIRA